MILKVIKVNTNIDIVTNSYIFFDENKKEGAIIDPGGEAEKIIEMLNSLEIKIKYIILTHCHIDHIGALQELKDFTKATILVSRKGAEEINNPDMNLSSYFESTLPYVNVDARIDDGDLIHIGNIQFKVLETPGHTIDSICLYCEDEKLLFSGDTIFAGSWGRTDLPSGDMTQIMDSINEKILVLPEETVIYPGHDRPTTVGDEKVIYKELRETDI